MKSQTWVGNDPDNRRMMRFDNLNAEERATKELDL